MTVYLRPVPLDLNFDSGGRSGLLAMKLYTLWTERVFSQDGFESLLALGIFAAALAVPVLAQRRAGYTPYFSGGFALALCPFLFAGVLALLRMHDLIEYEDLTPSYVVQRLQSSREVLLFGGCLSLFCIVMHTAIRAAVACKARTSSNSTPRGQ